MNDAQQKQEHDHARAVMLANGQQPPSLEQLLAVRDAALDSLDKAIAERDRQLIRCAVNGPHRRAMNINQRDAGHLPLFTAANESELGL